MERDESGDECARAQRRGGEQGEPAAAACQHATRTLARSSSYTFKRAFFRAYIAKQRENPTHLGTVLEGSCPYVQRAEAAPAR